MHGRQSSLGELSVPLAIFVLENLHILCLLLITCVKSNHGWSISYDFKTHGSVRLRLVSIVLYNDNPLEPDGTIGQEAVGF